MFAKNGSSIITKFVYYRLVIQKYSWRPLDVKVNPWPASFNMLVCTAPNTFTIIISFL